MAVAGSEFLKEIYQEAIEKEFIFKYSTWEKNSSNMNALFVLIRVI
jgi:hypothetical protein